MFRFGLDLMSETATSLALSSKVEVKHSWVPTFRVVESLHAYRNLDRKISAETTPSYWLILMGKLYWWLVA